VTLELLPCLLFDDCHGVSQVVLQVGCQASGTCEEIPTGL
jgi:hypothetical protein